MSPGSGRPRSGKDWHSSLNNGNIVGCVAIDMSKAFDVLCHPVLLQKLHMYGCSASTVMWFMSYLTGRKQCVEVDQVQSETRGTQSGVPQGSILGPLLFSVFVNDLPLVVSQSTIELYADDATIYAEGPTVQAVQERLAVDLKVVETWCDTNKLVINPEKCKSLLICSQQKRRNLTASTLTLHI